MHMHTHIHAHTHAHIHIHVRTHTTTHVRTHTHAQGGGCTHTHTHIHTQTHAPIHTLKPVLAEFDIDACGMVGCVYACMHACIFVCVCLCVRVRASMCVCVCVRVCVCVCACVRGIVPASKIQNVLSSVMTPGFSKIQNNILKFRENFKIALNYTSLAFIPFMLLLSAISTNLIPVMYGDKWEKAVRICR